MNRKPTTTGNSGSPRRDARPAGYDPEAGIPRYLLERRPAGGGALANGAIFGALIALLPSYFAAEASLVAFAHPVHWLGAMGATAAGAGAGAFTGWLRGRRLPN